MADTKVISPEVKPENQTEKTEKTDKVILPFEFSKSANDAIFEVFARSYGAEKLAKASATRVKTLYGQWLRERMLKAVVAARNSALVAEYNRMQKAVDDLVDSGTERIKAEEEVFGMTGPQKRRQLTLDKAARLF